MKAQLHRHPRTCRLLKPSYGPPAASGSPRRRAGSTQIVPGGWIDDITTNRDRDAWEAGNLADYFPGLRIHCRIQWYAARGEARLLFSFGIHGQNLFVDRRDQIVVAKVSSQALPLDTGRIELTMRAVSKIRSALGWDGGKT